MNQQYTTDGNSDIYCSMFGLQCEISGCLGLLYCSCFLFAFIHKVQDSRVCLVTFREMKKAQTAILELF